MLDLERVSSLSEEIEKQKYHREYSGSLFGQFCFYVFWHDPTTYLLPTILSARHAGYQLLDSVGTDYSSQETTKFAVAPRGMRIAPLLGATWFSDAVSLLLADPDSNFGIKMTSVEICELLASETRRPRHIVGLQIPTNALTLDDWRDLIPEQYVTNEQFYYEGNIYGSRADLALVNPQAKGPTP